MWLDLVTHFLQWNVARETFGEFSAMGVPGLAASGLAFLEFCSCYGKKPRPASLVVRDHMETEKSPAESQY